MLERLVSLIQPPAYPPYARGNWDQVESAFENSFPNDYKELIWTYGSGKFFDFLGFYNPFDPNKYVNFPNASKMVLESLGSLKRKFPDELPFALYPDPGGLLPIGQTDNGDYIHWHTRGQPDEWGVVVTESRGPNYDVIENGLAEFLCALATHELELTAFPLMDDAPANFAPYVPNPARILQ